MSIHFIIDGEATPAEAAAFVEKFASKASRLPAGDPRGPVVLGSLIDVGAAAKMEDRIADAVAKGAVLVAGGKAVIAEFTDLRWITIEGPQHHPFREPV